MSALQKIAVAVLFAILVLYGCGTSSFNPNDPFPEQPVVTDEVNAQLAGKKLNVFPVYVDQIVKYRKLEGIPEDKVIKSFTKEFLPLPNPSASTIGNSKKFLEFFKKQLGKGGFNVVESACELCISVRFTFAEYKTGNRVWFFNGAEIYYHKKHVATTRDDRRKGWAERLITIRGQGPDDALLALANTAVDEVIQAWNWSMESRVIKQASRTSAKVEQ